MAKEIEKHPAQWALDLFEATSPDLHYKSPLMYFPAFVGAFFGAGTNIGYNILSRRPRCARLDLIILATICGASFSQFMAYMFRVRRVRKDTMICDYIRQHPEYFPEPENRKYADILEPWNPIR